MRGLDIGEFVCRLSSVPPGGAGGGGAGYSSVSSEVSSEVEAAGKFGG